VFVMEVESRATKHPLPPGDDADASTATPLRHFAPARQYLFTAERAERAARARSAVPERAVFKDGAQVILTVNLAPDDGLVNGSRGVVTDVDATRTGVEVTFACGVVRVIEPYEWVHENELGDRNELAVVVVRQIPLILGWASTIHRAQGMTLDCVEVDLGPQIFSAGMAYVALSRVRELGSLSFLQFAPEKVYAKPVVKAYYDFVERNGTHAGFLDQVNRVAWPRVSEMRALAARLPAITEQRDAACERRRAEAVEREEAIGGMSLAAAYAARMQQFVQQQQQQPPPPQPAAKRQAEAGVEWAGRKKKGSGAPKYARFG
jgi:hypothetical protein